MIFMRLYPVFSLLLKDYVALKNNTDKDDFMRAE